MFLCYGLSISFRKDLDTSLIFFRLPNAVDGFHSLGIRYFLSRLPSLITKTFLDRFYRGRQYAPSDSPLDHPKTTTGRHSVVLDGSGLAAGVYVVALKGEGFVKREKVVLIR